MDPIELDFPVQSLNVSRLLPLCLFVLNFANWATPKESP